MNVFVTGAGGLVGRALVMRLVKRGYEVTALVRSSSDITHGDPLLRWVIGDIRDAARLRDYMMGADYVVHLAARKADEPDSREINVQGTLHVIDAAAKVGVKRVVHIGTMSSKLRARGIYGETKREADEAVLSGKAPSVILKFSVIYADFESGIFGTLARYSRLPVIPLVGPGKATYRPIHVDDAAEAIEIALSAPPGSVYEIGGPDIVSLNDLAQCIAWEGLKKRPRIVHIPLWLGVLLAHIFSILPKAPITKSNIVGMNELVEVDVDPFYAAYNFRPRTLLEGIHDVKKRSKQRSDEPYAIMRYVSRGSTTDYYVGLYEKAVHEHGLERHSLDARLCNNALILGGFDAITRFTQPGGAFRKKLTIASAIYESSPLSAEFLLPRSRSIISIAVQFIRIGILVSLKLIVGLVLLLIPNFHARNA